MENNNVQLVGAKKDPSWILFLGACPALAASVGVKTALGMSLAVLLVMLLSAIVLSALRNVLSGTARVIGAAIVIAFLAAVVQLLMGAFLPKVAQSVGLYIAVLAVDVLVFAAAGDNAVNSSVKGAALYAVKCAVYFFIVVVITAVIREVLGAGEFFGMEIPFLAEYNIPLLVKAPGAFFTLAIVAAIAKPIKHVEPASESFASDAAGV